jgi:hypothetical protein
VDEWCGWGYADVWVQEGLNGIVLVDLAWSLRVLCILMGVWVANFRLRHRGNDEWTNPP